MWKKFKLEIIVFIVNFLLSTIGVYIVICRIAGIDMFKTKIVQNLLLSIVISFFFSFFISIGISILKYILVFESDIKNSKSIFNILKNEYETKTNYIVDTLKTFRSEQVIKLIDGYGNEFGSHILNKFLVYYADDLEITYHNRLLKEYSNTIKEFGIIAKKSFYGISKDGHTPLWFYKKTGTNDEITINYRQGYLNKISHLSETLNVKRIMIHSETEFKNSLKEMSSEQFNHFMGLHENIDLFWYNTSNENDEKVYDSPFMGDDFAIFDNNVKINFVSNGSSLVQGDIKLSKNEIEKIERLFEDPINIASYLNKEKIIQLYNNK